jgi:hypothetical protein
MARDRTRYRDPGHRVSVLASQFVTPMQVAELFAVKLLSLDKTRMPIHASHYHSDTIGPLVRRGLLRWERPTPENTGRSYRRGSGWDHRWGREWRVTILTDLGERVLLEVAEQAMVATGRMKAISQEEDES